MVLRHLLSILILPFMMAGMIPRWIEGPKPIRGSVPEQIAGALIFLAGFFLFAWCVSLFAVRGKGTLAPWDPPKKFVAIGPYLHTRNPMITGVLAMIIGQAVFHRSLNVALWALAFFVINQVTFLMIEEPGLERRFGQDYMRYKQQVPRWIPTGRRAR